MSLLDKMPVEQIDSIVKEILSIEKIQFENKNPDTSLFDIYYNFPYSNNLKITITKQKANDYNIDVVSSVSFSPVHVDALQNSSQEIKDKMLNDIFLWLTPREPEYFVILDPETLGDIPTKHDKIDRKPFYIVRLPVYTDALTLSNLMRSIRLVSHSSLLARRQIQLHLNPIVHQLKEKAKNNPE